MFLLIDNYDSFTYNLWHYLGELGAEVVVRRNDALTVDEALALRPQGIVISPGPSDPDHAGICLELVRRAGTLPLLGVCLGHQAIGQAFGGRVVRADVPMHGKVSAIRHDGSGVFAGLPNPFNATRYHSLIVADDHLPRELEVSAHTVERDGTQVIMGLRHRKFPVEGVQFHPESVLTDEGKKLVKNFLKGSC